MLLFGSVLAAAGLAGVRRGLERISTEPVSTVQTAGLLVKAANSALVLLGYVQANAALAAPAPSAEPLALLILGGRSLHTNYAEEVVIVTADPASGRVALVTLPAAIDFTLARDAAGLEASRQAAEALSGLRLRGVISVDTEAFIYGVNALGGLELSGNRLDGASALAYLRDPGTRLERAHDLLAALADNPLTTGVRLVRAVDAAGAGLRMNLSTDDLLTLVDLAGTLDWTHLTVYDLGAPTGPDALGMTFATLFR